MNRRNFVRDTILGLAASLLPKILQPAIPEVMKDVQIERFIAEGCGFYVEEYRYDDATGNCVKIAAYGDPRHMPKYISYENNHFPPL